MKLDAREPCSYVWRVTVSAGGALAPVESRDFVEEDAAARFALTRRRQAQDRGWRHVVRIESVRAP